MSSPGLWKVAVYNYRDTRVFPVPDIIALRLPQRRLATSFQDSTLEVPVKTFNLFSEGIPFRGGGAGASAEQVNLSIDTLSGVPLYDKKTAQLLAVYFHYELSKDERVELAGKLLFPNNSEGAALFSKSLAGPLSLSDKNRLGAFALFPDNRRGAELYEISLTRQLAKHELLELYSIRSTVPQHEGPALDAKRVQLQSLFSQAQRIQQLDPKQFKKMIVEFVKAELGPDSAACSTNQEICTLFGVTAETLDKTLKDGQEGLTAHESAFRQERLLRREQYFDKAIEIQAIQAMRNLVTLENELHKDGSIATISPRSALATLFGITHEQARYYLRFIPNRDSLYREEFFDNRRVDARKDVVDSVRLQIDLATNNTEEIVNTDQELADNAGVLPITVSYWLREDLTRQERMMRDHLLGQRNINTTEQRTLPQLAKDEIAAFMRGEIDHISRNHDLAERYHLDVGAVCDVLNKTLTLQERECRTEVLALQSNTDVSVISLRRLGLEAVKHRVQAALVAEAVKNPEINDAKETTPSTTSKRRRVHFRGANFDSAEEAACATLLRKYVPGFRLTDGLTHQIPVGNYQIDFRVKGCFVEYHPMRLFRNKHGVGDFGRMESYQQYCKIRDSLSGEKRTEFIEQTRLELAAQYTSDRQAILDSQDNFKGSKLMVVTSPEEFYYRVLGEFGTGLPAKNRFLSEFRRIAVHIRRSQKK